MGWNYHLTVIDISKSSLDVNEVYDSSSFVVEK